MNYYVKGEDGQIQLTEGGREVLDYLGLSLDDLKRMPPEQLVTRIKRMGDVLNDGSITQSNGGTGPIVNSEKYGDYADTKGVPRAFFNCGDSGSFSRYFSLDAWWEKKLSELPESVQKTFPFLIEPKAGKGERDNGLRSFEEGVVEALHGNVDGSLNKRTNGQPSTAKNRHPTVKPVALMSYLVTLGSRQGDVVLDPFMGSGTTGIAAKMLGRAFIGIEIDPESFKIAKARVDNQGHPMDSSWFEEAKS